MKIVDIRQFKNLQYKILLLLVFVSIFLILIIGQIPVGTNREVEITSFPFVISILANILFLLMVYLEMIADRIFERMNNIEKFHELKGSCVLIAVVSYLFILFSSVGLYSEFGETFIMILALTITIFGIIIPIIWMLIDNRKYKVLFR